MKITTFFILIPLFFASCGQEKKSSPAAVTDNQKDTFEMYEMSEMAALMEKMYEEHQLLKVQLETNRLSGDFPEYLLEIYTAACTDASDNDTVFKNWSDVYIQYEKNIYTDRANAKTHYNNAVNACIMCHEQKCTRPHSEDQKTADHAINAPENY